MASFAQMTPSDLNQLIGTPDAPIIIDLCIDEDFDADPRLIPGAFRHPFDKIHDLIPQLSGKSTVLYCQKGKKLSQGACAILRSAGLAADTLEGGQIAWAEAKLPMITAAQVPQPYPFGATTWVTPAHPDADQLACAWLLRRFVDPQARFLFVARSEVLGVAQKFGATPFDVEGNAEGAPFTQTRGTCSFESMCSRFELKLPALAKIGQIIRAVDTNKMQDEAQAAGLLAILQGLALTHRDDEARVDAGLVIYDALYHWACDKEDQSDA